MKKFKIFLVFLFTIFLGIIGFTKVFSDTNDFEFKDLELFFIDDNSKVTHYTIMDRNMGATEVLGEGLYYQWGNKNGFTDPVTNTSTTRIPYKDWKDFENTPSTYKHYTFIKGSSNWQDGTDDQKFNSNLWGGKNDTTFQDGDGKKANRQGPCLAGYYVPSAHDANTLVEKWKESTQTNSENYYKQFATDLLLTRSGIKNNGDLDNSYSRIWTSSPAYGPKHDADADFDSSGNKNHSRTITFISTQFNIGIVLRGYGLQVRCFKDDFDPENGTDSNLNIHPDGGVKAVLAIDSDGKIHTLGEPTKDGYDFLGWYTTSDFREGTEVKKGNILKGNNLYARWEWTVKFVDEDGTELKTSHYKNGTPSYEIVEPDTPTKQSDNTYSYTFAGWSTAIENVTKDAIYKATYTKKFIDYTIKFVNWDDDEITSKTDYHYGNTVIVPDEPTRQATPEYTYTFAGWDSEITSVTGDKTYKATYTETPIEYTISYNLDGGTNDSENPAKYTVESENITLKDPTKTGYTFKGWFAEAEFNNKITEITTGTTGNKTFYAKWSADNTEYFVKHFKEKIDSNDFDLSETETKSGNFDSLTEAEAKNYTGFEAQSFQQQKIGTSTIIEINYKRKVTTITFNDGNNKEITGKYEANVTPPTENPTKEGYTFDGRENLPTKFPADDITIEPKWKINQYTITFETNGGTTIAPITQDYNTDITAPADPTKTGYTFAGWSESIPTKMPAENKTINANWTINQYTIIYNNLDGANFENQTPNPTTYTVETDTFTLNNPTKEGFSFTGWTYEGQTTPEETVTIGKGTTGDKNYTANWQAQNTAYTVKHLLEKVNTTPADYELKETETKNGLFGSETEATAKNYTGFEAPQNITQQTIGKDTVIEIKYNRKTVKITFTDLDGNTTEIEGKYGNEIPQNEIPADPQKDGYTCNGWNFKETTFPAENKNITANCTKKTGGVPGVVPVIPNDPRVKDKEDKVVNVDGKEKEYTIDVENQVCPVIKNILGDYNSGYVLNFPDTNEAKNKEEFQRLAKVGIVNGTKEGLLEPTRNITRAEFLSIVLQVHCYDISKKPTSLPFPDVDLESWHANVVKVGFENGIISGYPDGTFRPNDPISKIEAFAIMMKIRNIEVNESIKDSYTDKMASWQSKPLSAGEYLGILKPAETNYKFYPDMKLSRDEMVKTIIDIIKLY